MLEDIQIYAWLVLQQIMLMLYFYNILGQKAEDKNYSLDVL